MNWTIIVNQYISSFIVCVDRNEIHLNMANVSRSWRGIEKTVFKSVISQLRTGFKVKMAKQNYSPHRHWLCLKLSFLEMKHSALLRAPAFLQKKSFLWKTQLCSVRSIGCNSRNFQVPFKEKIRFITCWLLNRPHF